MKPKPVKFSEFPQVSGLPPRAMEVAMQLFEDAVSYKRIIATNEEYLDRAIEGLEKIQKEFGAPGLQIEVDGVRWGFAYQQVAGRRQLNKIALMEKLGISKRDLDRCMVQGKDGERRTLKEIKGEAEGGEDKEQEEE